MHPTTVIELATQRHAELVLLAEQGRCARRATSGPRRSTSSLVARLRDRVRAVVLPQPEPCCV